MVLLLIAAALAAAAQPAPASRPANPRGQFVATGSVEEVSDYFRRICLAEAASLEGQRKRIAAETRPMTQAKSEVETWIAWPVQVSIAEADGFVQCFVASPVPAKTTMEQALKIVRPLVAGGDDLATQETLTGDYVTWRRVVGGRPQEVRFNLAAAADAKTAVISVSTKKGG